MLFCKLLAGIFLVGGVVQASYCFDIQRLIINNTKETKDAKEQDLPNQHLPNKPEDIAKFITETEVTIKKSEAEITTQSTKADETWAALKTKLNLANDDKKGIEGITEIIAEAQEKDKLITQQISEEKKKIKKSEKQIKKTETLISSGTDGFLQKLLHKVNLGVLKMNKDSSEQRIKSDTQAQTELTDQLTATQEALKDQLALKEKQDAKNALIAKIQLREESYE